MKKSAFSDKKDSLRKVLLFLFLVSISAFRLNFFIAVPAFVIIVLYSIISDGKIRITSILKWGVVFWGYYFLSVLWAHNITDTLRYISAAVYIIGIFVFLPKLIRDQDDINMTLRIMFYSIAFTAVYTLLITPFSEFGTVRIGSAIGLNENAFGMRMAIGVMIVLFLLKNKDQKINKILAIIFAILFSVLALLSGSKKGLIILILGLLAVTFIFSTGMQRLRKILVAAMMIFVMLFLIFNNSALYSTIGNRLERTFLTVTGNNSDSSSLQVINGTVSTTDKSLIERDFFKEQAIKLFKEYPVFGYGGNNFMTRMREINYSHIAYSHNNYTELLSTLGVVGLIAYYSFWIATVLRLLKIKKHTKNEKTTQMAGFFFSILVMLLLLDYGNVSYVLEFNMFILCIADIFINLSRKELQNENTESN